MRTEIVEVPRLEFVPIPESLTERSEAPTPPVSDDGFIYFKDMPGYSVDVLGALEDCNIKLEKIEQLSSEGVTDE